MNKSTTRKCATSTLYFTCQSRVQPALFIKQIGSNMANNILVELGIHPENDKFDVEILCTFSLFARGKHSTGFCVHMWG